MPKIKLPYYGDLYSTGVLSQGKELLAYQDEFDLRSKAENRHPEGSTYTRNRYGASIHRRWRPDDEGDYSDQGTQGVMGTANGFLDTLNLAPHTQIRKNLIMPEQATLARMEGMRHSNTVYGNSSATTTKFEEEYFNIPGLGLRWYQPYAASAALCHWSFFVSFNAWAGRYLDGLGAKFKDGVYTTMTFRCTLDGVPLPHTQRTLGENFFHPVSPGSNNEWNDEDDSSSPEWGPGLDAYSTYSDTSKKLSGGNPRYAQTEAHSALHFDLHHLIGSGDSSSGKYQSSSNLSQGYHEIGLQFAIDANQTRNGFMSGPVFTQNFGKAAAVDLTDTYEMKGRGHFNLTGKLSVGIRNARVVSFL